MMPDTTGHHDDYTLAMTHFQNYSQVSNAKLNIDKTEAFSLGGAALPTWRAFLDLHGVTKWYDKKSVSPIRYLGFHMVQSPAQRHLVNDRILQPNRSPTPASSSPNANCLSVEG
jgi:hypothetical protein